jgi:hypothetical protein
MFTENFSGGVTIIRECVCETWMHSSETCLNMEFSSSFIFIHIYTPTHICMKIGDVLRIIIKEKKEKNYNEIHRVHGKRLMSDLVTTENIMLIV